MAKDRELQDNMLELGTMTYFIKGQRVQWLGHIMCRKENDPFKSSP